MHTGKLPASKRQAINARGVVGKAETRGRIPKLTKSSDKIEVGKKKKKDRGTETREKKRKKGKKKSKEDRHMSSSSGSDTEDSSSSSSSSSSSEGSSSATSSSSSDSSSSGGKSKKSKKNRKGKMLDLDLLEILWPKEDRPRKLQSKKVVQTMSMSKILKMKELYNKEMEKKGLGTAAYGSDRKPKPIKYKAMKDDGETRLHPARFERMPRSQPKDYWQHVPTGRQEIYRHLTLQHVGVDNVPEATVVKLHDRKVPVDLDMMGKEVKDMRQVQLAVCNYVAVMRALHPIDMGGVTMQIVLTEAGWAEFLGETEKARVQLIKRFFENCVLENSGRAVRKEPPMDYEQVKARWFKDVAVTCPQLAMANVGQQIAAMGGGGGAGGSTGQAKQQVGGGQAGGGGGGKAAAPGAQGKTQGHDTEGRGGVNGYVQRGKGN